MTDLFAKKPLALLLEEARETGEHSLKRTLGVFQLTALGVGAVIGAGIFVLSGLGAHYAGPGLMLSFVLSGLGCAFAALCYAEFAAMIPLAGSAYTYAYATLGEIFAWIIGWDLTLEYAMGASTVSSGWSNHFIELLNIFHINMPLWLAYDHWTGLKTAENIVARQMAQASDSTLVPGTQAFLDKVSGIMAAQSPELLQKAHDLLSAPHLFGYEIAPQHSCVRDRSGDHRHSGNRYQGERSFQRHDCHHQGGVVLFVIGLGIHYINTSNWGSDWHSFAPFGFSGIGARSGLHLLRLYRIRCRVYHGAGSEESAARPSHRNHRIASSLHCVIHRGRCSFDGHGPWKDVNIEAPIARAFLDRGLTGASHIITLGALAGLTSVMLVMLLGQTRVLYSMANDGLLPKKFFADIHPRFRTPWKNTILVGLLAAIVGSLTPIDDIGRMVNIGTLLAFVIVCIAVMALRHTNPGQARPFRTPWVPFIPIMGILFNGYMMVKLGWVNWARLIIWLVIGMVVYFTYSRKHSRVQAALEGRKMP